MAPQSSRRVLVRDVGLGLFAGVLYAIANTWFDVLDRQQPFHFLGALHTFIDRIVPVLTGGLAGLALHHARLRGELARVHAARAEDLRLRLDGVERDQAVWVVAASTLHEVKNPLHAIGLLLEELERAAPDDRDALVRRVRAQLDRIDTSLDALRQTRAAAPLDSHVEIDRLVTDVVTDLRARLSGVDVEIDVRPARVCADPGYLRVIVENLVANAVDGRRNARASSLRLRAVPDAGSLVLEVSDDGPGLDADVEPFTPFSSTKPTGFGLGLPIARALARSMGGDLSHEPGARTTFKLSLRAAS